MNPDVVYSEPESSQPFPGGTLSSICTPHCGREPGSGLGIAIINCTDPVRWWLTLAGRVFESQMKRFTVYPVGALQLSRRGLTAL